MDLPDFVAFDTETTGLEENSKIVEIAAVRFRGDIILGQYSKLIDPGINIPAEATRINNITNSMVSSCPTFERVLIEFSLFMEDAILVAHNAPYDIGRLNYEILSLRENILKNPRRDFLRNLWFIDTMEVAKDKISGSPGFGLGKLAKFLKLPIGNLHRALDDSMVVMHLFNFMVKNITKEELRKYCRRFTYE